MIVYSLLFLMAALPALQGCDSARLRVTGGSQQGIGAYWVFMQFSLVILIGFRYEVGGDWFTYLNYLARAEYINLADLFDHADPGYVLLNVIASRLGLGVTGVNTLSAIVIVVGVFSFIKTLPRPWLALACAIPYLIIVVAMGYTRQSVALGFVLLGIVAMKNSHFKTYILMVVLGAAFHKTAVFLLPLAALVSTRRRIQKIGMVALATMFSFELFLSEHGQRLYEVYIEQKMSDSDGALIRLVMNAIPGLLYIFLSKKMQLTRAERSFWKYIAWLSVVMLFMLFISDYSTALDRMALYFIPLQIFVFSHLPEVFSSNRRMWIAVTLAYYALILLVWLNFATHAKYWLPYQLAIS